MRLNKIFNICTLYIVILLTNINIYTVSQKSSHVETLCNFVKS